MDGIEVRAADLSVEIGFPCGPQLPWPTALSLTRTIHACAKRGVDVNIQAVCGSSIITTARSSVAHRFLQSGRSRLFWIDSDMVWEPDDFFRVLGLTAACDIVTATYPLKREKLGYVIQHDDLQHFEVNGLGLLKVNGTGFGFACMTREVLVKIGATKRWMVNQATGEKMRELFRIDVTEDGNMRGEDIAFFEDARNIGFDVWLDPTINLGHVGAKTYTGDVVKALDLEHIYPRKEQ